jgi:predicted nucleic acid-binding protein
MSGFLIDTNCISEPFRPRPDPRVLAWLQNADERLLYLSVLTIGEIRRGIALLPQSQRRARLEIWLEAELLSRFFDRILPVTRAIADRWGLLDATLRMRGRILPAVDGLLAATAVHHNLTVVSRNVGDFAATQVPVLNPWEA